MDDENANLIAAELVYQGVNLADLAAAPIIDTTTTCPRCGHGEAVFVCPAAPTGHVETCCRCEYTFVDPTP
jgi:transposase-like protein